jgi:hypothetical protein
MTIKQLEMRITCLENTVEDLQGKLDEHTYIVRLLLNPPEKVSKVGNWLKSKAVSVRNTVRQYQINAPISKKVPYLDRAAA